MGDYGIKISQEGYDVKSATPTQLVFSSSYQSYKIPSSLQGSSSFSINAGVDYTLTITHNLGYIPAFDAWFKDEGNLWHSIFNEQRPAANPNVYAPTGSAQYATSTTVVLKLHNRGSVSRNAMIYYIVFVDGI